jgi:Predicted membrane protein
MAENDQIKKFIQILVKMAGVEESKEQSEKFYKTHHDGMGQSKKDAEEASPKIEEFLKRWKYELMLVGGAIAGIYALVKYSSVAHTMTDLLGRSFGFLADVILIALLPVVVILAGWILAVAKAFQDLPKWLKDLIAWGILTVIGLELVAKALALVGVSAGVTALLLGALAGLAIGISVVLLLREAGFFKALEDAVGAATTSFRNWVDGMSIYWHNFWVGAIEFTVGLWNNTLGNLPGMKIDNSFLQNTPETARWQDAWDIKAAEAYQDAMSKGMTHDQAMTSSFGDLSWKEWTEAMRKANPGREERWKYSPLTHDQVEATADDEDNVLGAKHMWLSLGEWLRNEKASSSGSGKLKSSDLGDIDRSIFEDLYPQEVRAPSPGSPQAGSPAKNETPQVTIEHAEIHLDPEDPLNQSFVDQMTQIVNRTNSTALRGSNFFG